MECHLVQHVYRVDIREVWPSNWMTHRALKPSAVTRWTLSLHTCSHLRGDRLAMKDKQNNKTTTTHKEEVPGMFQERHQIVRRSKKLFKITSIPLPQTPTHQVYFTGIHATDKVNADEYITIGREQMAEFKYGWPTNFNKIRH